jgi:hypothetical protein
MKNQHCLPTICALAIRRMLLVLVFALAVLAPLGFVPSVAFADTCPAGTWAPSGGACLPVPNISCPPGQIAEGGQWSGGQWACYPEASGEGG